VMSFFDEYTFFYRRVFLIPSEFLFVKQKVGINRFDDVDKFFRPIQN